MPNPQRADFYPPPTDEVFLGTLASASAKTLSGNDLAAGRVGRRWAGWFQLLFRRFSIAQFTYREFTANTTMVPDDCFLVAKLTTNATLTLLDATTCKGQFFYIKNRFNSTGAVALATQSSQLIDDKASLFVTITAGASITIVSDGANWMTLAAYAPTAGATNN